MNSLNIIHTESSLGWGGQEIRILSEAKAMLNRGHNVTLLTPRSSEIYHAARRETVPVHAIEISKKRLGSILQMRAWLKQHGRKYDVVNTHSSTDSWVTALAAISLPEMPAIVRTRHVSTPINNSPATRWLYQRATAHIVTTGESLRQQICHDNNYALSSMTSIRTGIDLAKFRASDRAETRQSLGLQNRPTIGIVATLRDWKGHEDLLDAFVLLRKRSQEYMRWQLVIVGDGPEMQRLKDKVSARDLNDFVSLVGNQDNVPEWLSAFDIFVLPSYGNEGVPQSIMQAMACQLPVVSTPVGAIAEALKDGESGMLVPVRNPAALADALARLMSDPALCKKMGQIGHQIAVENFGIDMMVDKMEAVFRQFARVRK